MQNEVDEFGMTTLHSVDRKERVETQITQTIAALGMWSGPMRISC